MSLKFSANVSTLFNEYPFLQRFNAAKENGFTHIEIQSPYTYDPKEIDLCGLKCDLINTFCEEGSFGYASVPGKEYDYCTSLTKMVDYYNVLNFKKVHILAGKKCPNFTMEDQFNHFVQSLDSATDFLEDYNLIGLIEPICPEVNENYFLSSFDMAVRALEATSNRYIKLLLDVYHLHKITGDVKQNLEKYYPYAGHIQISQDPGRREPFFPGGEIDFDFVFNFLKERNHQDVIGLEYFPSMSTVKSLSWMENYM